MIFQFGDIQFRQLEAPTSMGIEGSMNYAQIERLKNKPVLQKVGIPLQAISMNIELYYQISDVKTAISKLWAKMYSSKEEELIDGTGYSYGTFLIDRIRNELRKTDGRGAVLSASLSISFIEYAPYDQASSDKAKARKDAFATIEANPIEVKPRVILASPQAKASVGITHSIATTKEGLANVKKASSIPAMTKKYMDIATRQMKTASATLTQARAEVNNVTAVVSNIEQLKSTLDSTITMTDQMLSQMDGAQVGDLPGIIEGTGYALDNQLRTLMSTAAIITAVTSIRK